MNNNLRTRKEIVDKIEELYEFSKNGKLPLSYVMNITDALDWCLGDSNFLDTEELEKKSQSYKGKK